MAGVLEDGSMLEFFFFLDGFEQVIDVGRLRGIRRRVIGDAPEGVDSAECFLEEEGLQFGEPGEQLTKQRKDGELALGAAAARAATAKRQGVREFVR